MWLHTLQIGGVHADLGEGGATLVATANDEVIRWHLRHQTSTPRPGNLPAPQPGVVLWLPQASAAVRSRLDAFGWSWVTDSGDVSLRTGHGVISLGPHTRQNMSAEPPAHAPRSTRVERGSAGRSAVVQYLPEQLEPARQSAIAAASGLTQARVSQVLRDTDATGWTRRTATGWAITDYPAVFDAWIDAAVPPGLAVQGWYHLDTAAGQTDLCLVIAARDDIAARVCGDRAADRLAPWAVPRTAIVHAAGSLGLESAGFVPAALDYATLCTTVSPIVGSAVAME